MNNYINAQQCSIKTENVLIAAFVGHPQTSTIRYIDLYGAYHGISDFRFLGDTVWKPKATCSQPWQQS